MSRVAKRPVDLPQGVTATVAREHGQGQGRQGRAHARRGRRRERRAAGQEAAGRARTRATASACRAGAARAHLANMVDGRVEGLRAQARAGRRRLPRRGAGQDAEPHARLLARRSNFPIPEGISMETPSQTEIIIKGIDRQKVGQVAREDPRHPSAGALQGQGRALLRRADRHEGGQEEVILRHSYADHQERAAPAPRHQDPHEDPRAGRCPSDGASHAAAHLCAGVRSAGRQGARRPRRPCRKRSPRA